MSANASIALVGDQLSSSIRIVTGSLTDGKKMTLALTRGSATRFVRWSEWKYMFDAQMSRGEPEQGGASHG
jgi:hypothetical protein